ncbi:MAG TPA: IS1182 family transposase [Mycobacterium sp.]|nr:IS1182 family transposase [Mycobacterium sp.]
MTLGQADRQGDLLDDVTRFCDGALPESSIYAVLHRERDRLFPDEMFADLFSDKGRRSVPPSVLATVMVLQRLEGLSDRDAVERYTFDARWRYAAGVGGYDGSGWGRFAHTVLVDMRARLARSADPRRIFAVTLQAASAAGLVGAKRVLDSTPLYDAVATMDTITLMRSALRGLLRVADAELEAQLRAVLSGGDDYASTAKPHIDWDDPAAREALVDSRARDGYACLALLDGRKLSEELTQAGQLLATVLGQDLETTTDGLFRIARRVAKDRVISTVDPEARHGHKTAARGFDGYKGHVAIDPDSEIITDTVVTPGNAGDASVAQDLINDLGATMDDGAEDDGAGNAGASEPHDDGGATASTASTAKPTVYGDNAYGTGEFHEYLAASDIESRCKTQQPTAAGGVFTKSDFNIDLDTDTVTCPNGITAPIRRNGDGDGTASFGQPCADCPLRAQCTKAEGGRTISVGRHERRLADARTRQQDPRWVADYRVTRPKVERKLAHLMRYRHGGRRARVRGTTKIDADFNLLAAAQNLARLARLGLRFATAGWAVATP